MFRMLVYGVGALLIVGVVSMSAPAQASDLVLGVETSAGTSTPGSENVVGTHTSWGVRVGVALPVPVLRIVPEGRLSIMSAQRELPGSPVVELQSARFGGKLGLEGPVSPFVYGHMGWTRLAGGVVVLGGESLARSYDAGLGLDVTFIPVVSLGATVGTQWMDLQQGAEPLSWLEAGVHLEISF